MAAAGVRAVIEPAFWVGQPRTHVGTFVDYFARSSAGSGSAPRSSACALLRHRPQLQGGQQRGPGRRGARDPAALRAQGGRGRHRRDRLRRALRRRGARTTSASSSSPSSTTWWSWSTRRTATRSAASCARCAIAEHGLPLAARHRPQQRGDRRGRARGRRLGGVHDLPAHQDGLRAHGRDRAPVRARAHHRRQLGLRLGRVGPAGVPKTARLDARARHRARSRSG